MTHPSYKTRQRNGKMSKIDMETARAIRAVRGPEDWGRRYPPDHEKSLPALSKRFGLSKGNLWKIIYGHAWREL